MSDISPKSMQCSCSDCGQPFQGISIAGFFTMRCADCATKHSRAKADEEQYLRRIKLEDEWTEICPADYIAGSVEECKANPFKTDTTRLPVVQAFAANGWTFGKNKGLWFNGPPGKCKTRLMWHILKNQLWMEGYKVTALTAAQFSRGSSDSAAKGQASEWAERLVSARALFIDDLGKGRMTELNEADLFDILDRRIASGTSRPTFVTSNLQLKQFAGISLNRGEPLIRRLNLLDMIAF